MPALYILLQYLHEQAFLDKSITFDSLEAALPLGLPLENRHHCNPGSHNDFPSSRRHYDRLPGQPRSTQKQLFFH